MNIGFKMRNKVLYLYYEIHGEYCLDDFTIVPGMILQGCRQENQKKVLVNCLGVTNTNLIYTERYLIGKRISELIEDIKVAVAWPEKDMHKFTDLLLVTGGANYRSFKDILSAEYWLLSNS